MKKISLFLAAALLGSASASAQLFVGGSLGFQSNDAGSSYTLAPTIGYAKGEKLEFGLHLGYGSAPDLYGTGESETISELRAGLFGRYQVFSVDKLSLWGQASLDLRVEDPYIETGLYIIPVVKYALTDNFYLKSEVNLFHLNFVSTAVDGGDSGTDIRIGVGGTETNGESPISIGFEYKF
ncbi:hypothetical protein AGMMS49982_02740 [Bacteroidia bacterium]|nr:hypothetical protein AGMMS49982_02740 [Bacteroidia bacterium]